MKPGLLVTPSIRLTRPLGGGGMGSIWLAEHLTLKAEVVVKFMSDASRADPSQVDRFSREASAASQVKSPHVVQMLDHGVSEEGGPFIAMEYLDGVDLRDHIRNKRRLSLAETAEITTQACKALARAHERGIIHRDIKPGNMFLCNVGGGDTFLKLLDFGIAKSLAVDPESFSATKSSTFLGTPFYMSPEQIVGAKHVDLRTDLWSLGVVVFEMMTGQVPFRGDTLGAVTLSICSDRMRYPSEVNPELSRAIDSWFERACARDRNLRFSSASEFANALHAAIALNPHAANAPAPTTSAYLSYQSDSQNSRNSTSTASRSAVVSKSTPPMNSSPRAVLIVAGALVALAAAGVGAIAHFTHARATPAVDHPVAALAPTDSSPSTPTITSSTSEDSRVAAAPTACAMVSASPPTPTPTPTTADAPTSAPSVVQKIAPPKSTSHVDKASAPKLPPPVSCDPPFVYDSAGNKVYKKECLQ